MRSRLFFSPRNLKSNTMFVEIPEISDNLEWMLQSRQVGDVTLVHTLVKQHYAKLYSFGLALFNSNSKRAQQLAEKVIIEAVETAGKYRGEVRVKWWLLTKTIKTYQNWTVSQAKHKSRKKSLGKSTSGSLVREEDEKIRKSVCELDERTRLVFLLKYHQGLNKDGIAHQLNIQKEEVGARLNLAVRMVGESWWGSKTSILDGTTIRKFLFDWWPIFVQSEKDEIRVVNRILSILQAKARRKHRSVIFGEFLLIVLVMTIVFSISSMIKYLIPEPDAPKRILQTQIVNRIILITPTPVPTQQPTSFPEHAVLYIADESETLATIATYTNINVEILKALNGIPADQPLADGQIVMIGVKGNQVIVPDESMIESQQSNTITKMGDPLHPSSSDDEIRKRLFDSRRYWDTLWAEAFTIQYGPAGYVGGPVVRRQQIWINQPFFSYFVEGDIRSEIEYITVANAGLIKYVNLQTGQELNTSGSDLVLFSENLHQLLLPSEIDTSLQGEIDVLGKDQLADREALVFDWYKVVPNQKIGDSKVHQGRYWIDTSYGVILRRQIFTGSDLSQLFEDIVITSVKFDIDIPERLFEDSQHLRKNFVQDYRGEPISNDETLPTQFWLIYQESEKLLKPTPPSEFDPARGYLTFRWTTLSAFDPQLGAHADIFSNGFYLGNIEFVDPKKILCARSSDGKMIAFTGWSDEVRFGYVPLRWVNLDDLGSIQSLSAEIVPYDFAFSPDNRQLAVYGCQREGEEICRIYLVDTKSGETRSLTRVEQGNGLSWSSDGQSIVIQGSLLRRGKWRVLAFSTQTGNVIYDGPFDWEGFWVEPDSPLYDWGVDIPPVRGGLEICAEPPRDN